MSSDPTASTPTTPEPSRPTERISLWRYLVLGQSKPGELIVYRHSSLFYWWPVWFLGFIMAGITYYGDMRMAVVPRGTQAVPDRQVFVDEEAAKPERRDVLILPKGKNLPTADYREGEEAPMQPTYAMAESKGWGSLFMVVLLVVIVITNIALRGLWSFLMLTVLIMLALLATAAGWWETIWANIGHLAIYINLGGYLLLSIVLLVLWFVTFFFFDRQTYMVFTPGQVRLRKEIGEGEIVYDTMGIVVQKRRGDLFRHWVLGFGSGDLVIRPAGVANPIELPNVLRVGVVVKAVNRMIKEKVILSGQPR